MMLRICVGGSDQWICLRIALLMEPHTCPQTFVWRSKIQRAKALPSGQLESPRKIIGSGMKAVMEVALGNKH
jgi:hypothetical protein